MRKGNKGLVIFFILLFALGIILGYGFGRTMKNKKKKDDNQPQEQVIVNGEFSYDMLRLLNDEKNMIYSPLSIRYALSMVRDGASGDTKTEIEKVIGNGSLTKYEGIKDRLSLANGLFIKDTFKSDVKDSYIKLLESNYGSEIIYDPFTDAKNVNKWIEDKTFKMLQNVIPDEAFKDPYLRMIIVNALAMDMEWEEKFITYNTSGGEFTNANGEKVEATMMKKTFESGSSTKYLKGDKIMAYSQDFKEYDGQQFEYIAILPDGDLKEYIKNLDEKTLNDTFDKLGTIDSNTEVHLSIPKYEYTYTVDGFIDKLKTLGIKKAFSEKEADLSGMSNVPLYVSDGIHKAKIEFSEDGVKAAAVTAFLISEKSAIPEPKKVVTLNYNKPFFYVIRDKKTKEIWFMGTVYEPNLWKNDKANYEK